MGNTRGQAPVTSGMGVRINSIEQYIQLKVPPEQQTLLASLRQLMQELAPKLQETISHGIPAWKGNTIVAVANVTQNEITLSFARGAEFKDQFDRLKGMGKVSKHLKIKTAKDIEKEVIGYYLGQAMELDGK